MSKTERTLFLLLATAIWIYLGLRAHFIPFIHDEAVTYFAYQQSATFLPPGAYLDANNHFLNSALGALFNMLFGHGQFALRLASWLSFPVMIWFVYGIAAKLPSFWSRWTFIIPLVSAPFFIEFYSLNRGYGAAMSWFLGTLFFAMQYTSDPHKKTLWLLSATGLLATLSNLSVIVAVLTVFGWVLLYQLLVEKKNFFKTTFQWLAIFVLPQLPLIGHSFILREKGLLYYGGDDFILYTLKPFALFFYGNENLWWLTVLIVIIIGVSFLIQMMVNGMSVLFNDGSVFSFVLILSLIAVFSQHFLLDVNYPEDRAALYFFPLLVGSWAFLPVSGFKMINVFFFLPSLWFPADLVSSINLDYHRLKQFEHLSPVFVDKVNKQHKNGYPATLNGYFLRYNIWNFLTLDKYESPAVVVSAGYPGSLADFLLLRRDDTNQVNTAIYLPVAEDSISGHRLFKRLAPVKETFVKDTLIENMQVRNEYSNIFEFNGQTWGRNAMILSYDIDTKSSSAIMRMLLIATLYDTTGQMLFTAKYHFNQVSENWLDKKGWKIRLYLPPFPENAGRFVTFIHNPDLEEHVFTRIGCELSSVSLNENE